jgi:hypothetical protein
MSRESWWLSLILLSALCYLYTLGAEAKCTKFIENQAPRGMLCLQCLSHRAPQGVTPFISLLKESCLRKPALGFVIDGTFGYNETRLIEAVQGLSEGGRKGALHLYIYNGPAQRRWQSNVFSSFAVMDPFLFRHKILQSVETQNALRENVTKLSTVLEYAKERGVSISIAPGLEDNLGDESFAKALSIVKEAVPTGVKVRWVRSPCIRCSVGNDTSIPSGVSKETHTRAAGFSHRNGIVSNDGEHVRFSFETTKASDGNILPLVSDLKFMVARAEKLKNTFLLWIPKYQDSPYGVVPRSPAIRTYRKPTVREKVEIIKLLRSSIS